MYVFTQGRRSVRLPMYDYSSEGAYFITICAQDRMCLFGDVVNGEMALNEYGRIVRQCWDDLAVHYSGIELDAFVIMPNHVHGIIIITGDVTVINPVGAGFKPAPTGTKRHGLPELIRAFKTFSAREINTMRNTPGKPVWQRNYWEHIIRNDNSYETIRRYIIANTLSWDTDDENPDRAIRGRR